MDVYNFSTFVAYAITVFLLASCLYRKHIQSPRAFFWALGIFITGLFIIESPKSLQPPIPFSRGITGGAPSAWSIFVLLVDVGRWIMYASLPVFVVACIGHGRAFAQCSRCGYDLTGNSSGVCPECGAELEGESKPR